MPAKISVRDVHSASRPSLAPHPLLNPLQVFSHAGPHCPDLQKEKLK